MSWREERCDMIVTSVNMRAEQGTSVEKIKDETDPQDTSDCAPSISVRPTSFFSSPTTFRPSSCFKLSRSSDTSQRRGRSPLPTDRHFRTTSAISQDISPNGGRIPIPSCRDAFTPSVSPNGIRPVHISSSNRPSRKTDTCSEAIPTSIFSFPCSGARHRSSPSTTDPFISFPNSIPTFGFASDGGTRQIRFDESKTTV
ncbi:hypothetical protein BLNAU_15135 [Blattamonas nauphoetae]|uniref:Uncharacterized protein n=1 Tax=Blattamonas nauphoetae TaxID=2049346 RepID=A0ABQ9XD84_9EUKA|nr:hypothetical protein BLNAU_15135 [Blattamonas nauphoetae]